ncbi:FKBP-type peptidyl-prolyl cis-trans isomerase (trigger factor) (Tig) (PDB:5OWI) [Commensalibacter communis]|uniref:Trigger factor n=1 Tax=Commensalibacter communis TaxID=2972786 RepID=A0A9W4TML9_9PROT|nr:trigger factor [Commensalibacter communis]CAI3922285.1 FKBP-type peptidyl-prolyl cis-trans isomerase (trigger factor) (Tig) (PDB:5OWI) [Commensalibacter communis]CAI3922288.1 FKBP-type peptidyl-prolyl cis-trans isomerase (trigger factor) (Tig) (PDB:5OWI) [Commensalibacter communis]CAI3929426.1 FKBP-type peptidyl-prolyl cis-trans isomerase (trigger factor) (Tig) (PDB:5OWI) [Commensalibacter communis]CAI3930004.1 FKBP-type peptidyl-prolyl cis-trans isomerase (trigger factor) (Tig) (PDB:5OWI) [
MQVTETLSESLKRGFTIVIKETQLAEKRNARLAEMGHQMNIPGFRPGKIPLAVVKQRYGETVQNEVLNDAVGDAVKTTLEERGLRAAAQPQITLKEGYKEGDDLEFSFEVELIPEFEVPDFKGINLTRLKAKPDDEALNKALESIAQRQRDYKDIEEKRPAAKGDVLVVDFVGKVDGVAFDGGTADDVNVEIGGSGFIPGFAEQIEGMTPGEEKQITVTFPEDYQAPNLAGKEATFDIKAKGLKEAVTPEINDEFAKKVGLESLDNLKDLVGKQISSEYDQMSHMRLKRDILDVLAEKVSFEIPAGLLDAEFNQIWQRIEADRKEGRLDEEDKAKDEETLKADYRKIAERRVRLGLLLVEIGRLNSIAVTDEELTQAMRSEAMRYPGKEKEVIEFFQKNPQAIDSLRGPIYENKVIDYILELATIEDKEVTAEELAEMPASKV